MKKVALALGLLLALVGVAAMVLSTLADRGSGVAAASPRSARSPSTERAEASPAPSSTAPDSTRLEAPPGVDESLSPDAAVALAQDPADPIETPELAATLLHVRDETGTPLGDLELVRITDWGGGELLHPAGSVRREEPLRRPSSPVEIGGDSTARATWYVRSPGFAWGRIQLDEGTGGERLLVLQPGGSLEVELVDPAAREGLVLRLRTAGSHSQPYAEAPLAGRTTVVLEGVAPGTYAVGAELGEWFRSPNVVAEDVVTVTEGERARLELVVDAPAPSPLVPLAGRLIVPAEWELDSPSLQVELLDGPTTGGERRRRPRLGPPEINEAGERVYRFEAGPVEPGRHEFEISPLHYSLVREVPPGGDEQVELRLPPPGLFELRVLDVDTGSDAGVRMVLYHPARPEGVTSGGVESVTADPDSGLFRIRAPEGELFVMLQGLEYQTVQDAAPRTFFVHAGETTSGTLSVRRSCGFTLRVRASGIDLPWDPDWRLEVEPVGGEGGLRGRGWSANEARFRLSEPGLYRFDFPTLVGFEPVPTQEVAVPAGEFVPHVVELVELP